MNKNNQTTVQKHEEEEGVVVACKILFHSHPTPSDEQDEFDAMTAKGFKFDFITGFYRKQ